MKLTHKLGAKIAAVILCLLSAVTTEIGVLGSVMFMRSDVYWQNDVRKAYFEYANDYSLYVSTEDLLQEWDILQLLLGKSEAETRMRDMIQNSYGGQSNCSILIVNEDQEEVYRTYQGEKSGLEIEYRYALSASVRDLLEKGIGDGRIYFSSALNRYYMHLYDARDLLGEEIVEGLVSSGRVQIYLESDAEESTVYGADTGSGFGYEEVQSEEEGGMGILEHYLMEGNVLLCFSDLESDLTEKERTVTVHAYVDYELPVEDSYQAAYRNFERFFQLRYAALALAILSALVLLASFTFLLFAAGHRGEGDEIVLNPIDRIPTEIYVAITGVVLAAGLNALVEYSWGTMRICLIVYFAFIIFFMASLTLAARLKAGTIVQNSLCGAVLRWAGGILKKGVDIIGDVLLHLPVIWKGIFIAAAIMLAEYYFFVGDWEESVVVLFWLLLHLFFAFLICYYMLSIRKLSEAGKHFSDGDWEYQVDTKHMYGEMKRSGAYLNGIGREMNRTVEERMKSERFKTELITNVSHDIKTPLTSIINYVDLMKKETMPSEAAKQYLEVIDRQSARLKKLIVDLTEASKASTGNITVELAPMDVKELVEQVAAEYEQRLAGKHLDMVLSMPEENALVLADGRHMWRILDNLLSNALKYSQEGTRIYIDLIVDGGQVILTVKNISNCALNISSDELLERFVRGDSSRNTEGSGLGLSIAQSLTELQKGKLSLVIDGDLFKVILTFDALEA